MTGIKSNDSKDVVVNSIVYYGGLANMRVVAINPDGETLKKMYNLEELKQEPEYMGVVIKDNEGAEQTYNKVVFHLQGEQFVITDKKDLAGNPIKVKEMIKTRVEYLVKDELKFASTGAPLTINALGNSSWQSEEKMLANPKMAWFTKYVPMHQGKVGEIELLEFVRNWMNVGSKDNCNFADFTAIANGNINELVAMAKARPNNEVTVLLGVNVKGEGTDKKGYQVVYKKHVSRPTIKNPKEGFNKAMGELYGEFKALYPNDLNLAYVTINDDSDSPDQSAAPAVPAGSNWVV
jgi:hypothetical protein